MAKRMIDAATFAQRWADGMNRGSTIQKYKEGVSTLDFNPLERAANADDAYLSGCQNGNAKRKRKLLEYSQQRWVDACINKGATRLGPGATASKSVMQAAGTRLLPAIQQIRSMLPQGTSKAARRERMIQFSDMMEKFGLSGQV